MGTVKRINSHPNYIRIDEAAQRVPREFYVFKSNIMMLEHKLISALGERFKQHKVPIYIYKVQH